MFLFKSHQAILEEALPFQGDLVRLLEEPLPKRLRGTIYLCISMIVLAFVIATVMKVDVVVNGRGKLTYDAPPVVLQAYERSVLRSLRVKPGDFVTKGQVLATLDPTFAQADLSALEARRNLVHAYVARLTAEANKTEYLPDPADEEAGILQYQVFQQRKTEYAARLSALESAVAESEASFQRSSAEKVVLEEQLRISSKIEEKHENLFNGKTSSELEYLSAKSARLRAERDFKETTDRLVEIGHHIESAKAQRNGFVEEWRRNIFEDLARQKSEESQIESAITKSRKVNSLVEIIAPEDGTVLDIADRSVGSIIRDTEPMVVLVPSAAPLLCEIELSSGEIGDVGVGDRVLVKVDAFPFQRFGGLHGKIRSIAFDSHAFGSGGGGGDLEASARKGNVSNGGVHKVVVELTSTKIDRLPEKKALFPGMTVVGEVHIGNRRLIQYILFPLLRGLQESFRES